MRSLAVCLATCGLIFASCSSNDVFEENKELHSDGDISFSANTTRAIVNTLDKVKGGFRVYATKADLNDWYIYEGNNNIYYFNTSKDKWDWQDAAGLPVKHSWPTTAAEYPMNFYAFYPQTADRFVLATTTVGTVTATITIEADPAKQTDFLAANYKNVTTKPASGKLNLMFGHITSKVNFSVIAGTGSKVFVQQLHMQNVGNAGTFKYNDLAWGAFTSEYLGQYKYYPAVVVPSQDKALPTFTPTTADESTKNPVYTTETDRHLMLRPQTNTPGWTWTQTKPAPTTPIVPTKAYIESVYRIEANGDVNAVGYNDASKHPDFSKLSAENQAVLKGKPLFVKVGFPLGATLTWEQGKGYNYNLMLGTAAGTGGIIIDNKYYDEKGNPTDLTIDGKDIGDPVNDGDIHFNVDVTEWGGDLEGSIIQ